RNKSEILAIHKLQQRPRGSDQRRRLIKTPIEPAENPIQLRHAHRNSRPRACVVLHHSARKMRIAHAAIQSEPRSSLELLLSKKRLQSAIHNFCIAEIRIAPVVECQPKELVVVLAESVEADARIILALD